MRGLIESLTLSNIYQFKVATTYKHGCLSSMVKIVFKRDGQKMICITC